MLTIGISLAINNELEFIYLLQATSDSRLITQVALYSLIPFSLTFSFVIFIFYRQNREAQIRKQHSELEMRALRAQMNPHFIFNCLNAIYRSIRNNDNELAGKYLLKFAFLTRRILENSSQNQISLEEEIDILKAYLDLEQMRTNEVFSYELTVDESLDIEFISVPMLLIQPFIENSIWYGFDSLESGGLISIHIYSNENQLRFDIVDNGSKSLQKESQPVMAGKRNSYGTQIVADQLQAIQKLEKKKAGYTFQDLQSSNGAYNGRAVHVYLPLIKTF